MDNRATLQELVTFLASIANAKGALAASNYINQNLPPDVIGSNDWLKGMNAAFQYSAINERKRLLFMIQALGCSGLCLPIETLFEFGLPQKGFIVNIDLTEGRIGDTLGKLARYVHAMIELNLVLLVKSRLSRSAFILVHNSVEFSEDVVSIDSIPPVIDYLTKIGESVTFKRDFLRLLPSQLFDDLPGPENLPHGLKALDNGVLVIHVRGGDALFNGLINLPPLMYYLNAIRLRKPNFVLIIAEPFYPQKDPFANPVPALIQSACNDIGVECQVQSSDHVNYDASTLFHARNVVASSSSFSKWIPIYGKTCKSLIIPCDLGTVHEWLQDHCIKYVNCWLGFDQTRWDSDIYYRLAWVSGKT